MGDPVLQAANIMQRLSLQDRACLITGAGSGIGRAIAHTVAGAGGRVALIDVNEQNTLAIQAEILKRNPGTQNVVLVADVTEPQQVDDVTDAVAREPGGVDVAHNNVGIAQLRGALDMPYEDFQRMIRVNLDSVFLGTVAQAKIIKKKSTEKL